MIRLFYLSRRRIAAGCLILLLVGVLCFLLFRSEAVSGGDTERLVPIYAVDTPENRIAVSFDASWGAEHTRDILAVLEEHHAGATFFLVNIWLEDYPELAKEIADRGYEIGLHSVTHSHFPALSESEIAAELAENAALIRDITGQEPRLFRCPYGDYDNKTLSQCALAGFTAVQWSIDSLDWQELSAEEIAARVTANAHAGDIVLFHNDGLHTAEALPAVLEAYAAAGLQVVSVSELLLEGPSYTDANGIQHAAK